MHVPAEDSPVLPICLYFMGDHRGRDHLLCELLKLTAWSCKGRAQSWVDGPAGTPSLRLRSKPHDSVADPLTAICGLGHTVSYLASDIPVGVA